MRRSREVLTARLRHGLSWHRRRYATVSSTLVDPVIQQRVWDEFDDRERIDDVIRALVWAITRVSELEPREA